MGEIRIVGPGKTRGYPYPVCKKKGYLDCNRTVLDRVSTHDRHNVKEECGKTTDPCTTPSVVSQIPKYSWSIL